MGHEPASWSETGRIVGVSRAWDGSRVLLVLLDEETGGVWPMRVVVTKTDGAES